MIAGQEPDWHRTRPCARRGCSAWAAWMFRRRNKSASWKRSAVVFDPRGRRHGRVDPEWRADIHGEADLVEEVLRVYGYDHIPAIPLERTSAITKPALNLKQKRVVTAKRVLAERGLSEAATWSFMSSAHIDLFGGVPDELRLLNPISADLDVMRPSILPNLIQAVGRNADRGYADVGLFEVGAMFRDPSPQGQDTVAAGVRSGLMVPRQWAQKAASG